jgi:hypothetical protein
MYNSPELSLKTTALASTFDLNGTLIFYVPPLNVVLIQLILNCLRVLVCKPEKYKKMYTPLPPDNGHTGCRWCQMNLY